VRDVEFPLVTILSDMELDGIYLYDDKWQTIITGKKHTKLDIERKLDEIVTELTGVKYNKPRNKQTVTVLDLFGNSTNVDNLNAKHLNYSSSKKMLHIIGLTGEPLPLFKEKGKEPTASMREAGLQQYLIERPFTKLRKFLTTYIDYKEAEKFINSYGIKFLNDRVRNKTGWKWGYKNSVTKKVHTIYKPCSTDTGRLASGDADAGYYNSQQIPAKKEIRLCFGLTPEEIALGYWLTTSDLSGAELIIMAALADDQHLYELGADKIINGVKVEGDLHSPLATKSWRAVYAHRLKKFIALHGKETLRTASREKLDEYFTIWDTENKPYVLTQDIVIDKSTNKQLRTDFKRMGFGVVYGLKDNKGAQTLNIPKDEAKVVINVISSEIPKTIKMVENAAVCALADGYVIFNNRSNNRRWFTPVLNIIDKYNLHKVSREERYHKVKSSLTFAELSDIEGAARNCRIQGTQADMIKEAMVLTHRTLRSRDPKSGLILSVHDELVAKHKDKEYGAEIARMMTDTANLYLAPYSSNIRMRAEHHTLTTWTK
jgi:DNA polymerase I-like protein with 3'-5' exonuclease and polymerase domains